MQSGCQRRGEKCLKYISQIKKLIQDLISLLFQVALDLLKQILI